MTMAQTLEVVCGLVNNVKVVINGTQRFSAGDDQMTGFLDRWQNVSGRHLEGLG